MSIQPKFFPTLGRVPVPDALPLDGLHFQASLVRAIEAGDARALVRRLERVPDFDLSRSLNGGDRALNRAAWAGHVAIVLVLLDYCHDRPEVINARGVDNETRPLMAACQAGHVEVVRLLCQAHARVNVIDGLSGRLPLTIAAMHDNLALIDVLCDAGADLEAEGLDRVTPLLAAVKAGNVDAVRRLHARGARLDGNAAPGRALFTAIEKDDAEMVRVVLELGAAIDVRDERTGDTPLLAATKEQNLSMVKLLLAAGAAANATDPRGYSALLCAVELNSPTLVTFLASHPRVDIGVRAHARLADMPTDDAFAYQRFVHHYTRNNSGRGTMFFRETALMVAARLGNLEALVAFLGVKRAPCDRFPTQNPLQLLEACNDEQSTALMLATQFRHAAVVEALCARGADCRSVLQRGMTPIMMAVKNNDLPVARILKTHGASVNTSGRNGMTPAMIAAWHGHHALFVFLESAGADLNAVDAAGHSALIFAIRAGKAACVHALLASGASPDAGASSHCIPLIEASKSANVEIIDALIHAGADLNARDVEANTALILAARDNHADIAQRLIDGGADIFATKNGRTAKQIARLSGASDVYQLLRHADDRASDHKRRHISR